MRCNTLESIILLALNLLRASLAADAQQPGKRVPRSGPPKFEGEYGHYERSKRFSNFIFKNQRKLVISFALYAARGRAYSGSSCFSTRAGVDRGMGQIPASCRASRHTHTTSS